MQLAESEVASGQPYSLVTHCRQHFRAVAFARDSGRMLQVGRNAGLSGII